MAQLRHPDLLLRRLLDGGHPAAAGRLAGAFRRLGDGAFADQIKAAMAAAGYEVRETDPFDAAQQFASFATPATPIEARLRALWGSCRNMALEAMPPAPGLPKQSADYLRAVDGTYVEDAYHSLSIEGYHVTRGLVAREQSSSRLPNLRELGRDALAARGYWRAFRQVRTNVAAIIAGEPPGGLARRVHQNGAGDSSSPRSKRSSCSRATLRVTATARSICAGRGTCRRDGKRCAPPCRCCSSCWSKSPKPLSGRCSDTSCSATSTLTRTATAAFARFLMNAMLASGGYPWTIIRVDDRADYMAALETASVESNIEPFAQFIGTQVRRTMALAEES